MTEASDKYQIWGTFSVMDHLREGAFLPEVIMYDRLVVPIPPDPGRATNKEELDFAEKQWARWERHQWNPARQKVLIDIIKPVARLVEWDLQRDQTWAVKYDESKRNAAQQFVNIMAGWVTGEVLLDDVPAMADAVVAVAPYDSLDDLKRDFGLDERSIDSEPLQSGKGLPGNVVSAVVGHQFLVPEDADRDEFCLLRQAVEVAQDPTFRAARRDFHTAQQQFIKNGRTDVESVIAAVESMDSALKVLHDSSRSQAKWTGLRRAFFFTQVLCDLASAPIKPVTAAKAVVALGKFTTDERLGNPSDPYRVSPAGALLFDAQNRLNLMLES